MHNASVFVLPLIKCKSVTKQTSELTPQFKATVEQHHSIFFILGETRVWNTVV